MNSKVKDVMTAEAVTATYDEPQEGQVQEGQVWTGWPVAARSR